MKWTTIFTYTLGVAIALYLFGAFVLIEPNVFMWDMGARGTLGFFVLSMLGIMVLIRVISRLRY